MKHSDKIKSETRDQTVKTGGQIKQRGADVSSIKTVPTSSVSSPSLLSSVLVVYISPDRNMTKRKSFEKVSDQDNF